MTTTRALFDERGRRDAPVDEIARAAGINKALIYRAFDSKEEIFVLTVADYLAELGARGGEDRDLEDPVAALRQSLELYVRFCLEYPAFLDCALALMQRPAGELREHVSGAVLFRLGQAMAATLGPLERILATGAERGVFAIDEPDFTANRMYTQVLGSMHLARAGVGVREAAPGIAETFDIEPERMCEACIEDGLALARISDRAKSTSA
ncbi:MAG: helix-turn-helix transcriptional regulator [Thermoleophilia bacterium]|nr:helix-turn-helix transcriptional regulator [Thermoleophilia bacterium]